MCIRICYVKQEGVQSIYLERLQQAFVFSFYCVQGFSSGPVELQAHYLTSLPTVSIQFLWALIRYALKYSSTLPYMVT